MFSVPSSFILYVERFTRQSGLCGHEDWRTCVMGPTVEQLSMVTFFPRLQPDRCHTASIPHSVPPQLSVCDGHGTVRTSPSTKLLQETQPCWCSTPWRLLAVVWWHQQKQRPSGPEDKSPKTRGGRSMKGYEDLEHKLGLCDLESAHPAGSVPGSQRCCQGTFS